MRKFLPILINTAVANITTSFLWFALTFWVYLETRSVLATGIIGGMYMLMIAAFGLVFGTYVDKHKKKHAMVMSSIVTTTTFAVAGVLYLLFPTNQLVDWGGPVFWLFAGVILAGAVVENMRNIALSTTVTLMIPKQERDKANGLVGAVQGIGFIVTSVLSGLAIGQLGMGWTLALALALTVLAFLHLLGVSIPEKGIAHDPELAQKQIDLKGALKAIHLVPGLMALIFFSTFNNLIGGVYMALMDPYGLTMFTVEQWGLVFGVAGTGFVAGGMLIAKFGLGKSPLRTLLWVLVIMGALGALFTIREWWWLYALGIWLYMAVVPFAEAAEQTVLQRVVPLEKQGRVFGFAQSFEAAAAPITAFLVAPLAQFIVIPHFADVKTQQQWSGLLGYGESRGIAFIFLVAGLLMIALALFAFMSRSYKLLSSTYRNS